RTRHPPTSTLFPYTTLFRSQADKARTIYQRVLELSPDDIRAQAALSTIPETPPEPPVADRKSGAAVPRKTTPVVPKKPERKATRSEEHTSELQSLAYLVCRL